MVLLAALALASMAAGIAIATGGKQRPRARAGCWKQHAHPPRHLRAGARVQANLAPARARCGLKAAADRTAPQTTITGGPPAKTSSTVAAFAFGSSESGSRFECRRESSRWRRCSSPRSYLSLQLGTHWFLVRARDAAGNVDRTPAVKIWTVESPPPPPDTTPPDTSIGSRPPASTASTSASFGFGSTEAGSSFECKLDAASWAACAPPKSYSGLAVGDHSFSVRARDAAGNTDPTPASQIWTITPPPDTTPPETSIGSGPPASTASTSASFGFGSTEAGSSFECKLDAASWAACAPPKSYSGLAVGDHSFSVRARDAAGNTDPTPASQIWTITPPPDTTPPETSIGSGPPASTASTSASFGFASVEAGSTYECSLDGSDWSACSSPQDFSDLAVGNHHFSVRARDAAGNTDPTPASQIWTITPPPDTTPPETSITGGPEGETTDTAASFSFGSSEAGSSFECSLDGSDWSACSSPQGYGGLAIGDHHFSVRARDPAGNTDETPAEADWVVVEPPPDTTPPETSITTGPAATTVDTSANFAFTSSEAGSSFECSLDGSDWSACASPKPYSGLTVASHHFSVRARDAAGNTDETPAEADWVVVEAPPDTTPPETSITTGPAATTVDTSANFAFTSSEAGSSFECSLDGSDWSACTSPKPYSSLALGAHQFSVRARDAAGNLDLTPASQSWTITPPPDTTPPDTSIGSAPPASTASTSASFGFASTEAGSSFECKLDAGSWAACTSPKPYSSLALGAHQFSVRARDAAGNLDLTPASQSWTITPPPDTTPPDTSIGSAPPASTASTSASFSFTASEAGSNFDCKLDAGSWAACTSPKPYSSLALGAHQFSVRARDAAGNLDPSPASHIWTITPPPDTTPPDTSIGSAPPASTASTSASFSFTASEAGSNFDCKLDAGSWAACTSPKPYSSLALGAHQFSVRARDAAGNLDLTPASQSWTVTSPPPPPPPSGCDTTVASVSAAQTAVSGASPGSVVCLANGSYGKLSLNATKAAPGVEMRSEHPGGATVAGGSLNGSRLTLSQFRVIGDEVTVQPGSTGMVVDHNLISGGYFGVDAGPTSSTYVNDVSVIGNKFQGPFGEDAIRANRYHDTASDADSYGLLVQGNEFTNVRENGNHSDCLQSVWGGDNLVFDRNYLHDNRCQGFFIKDQPSTVTNVVASNNLFVRNGAACDNAPGCGQPSYFQLFAPEANVHVFKNTIWTPESGSPTTFRDQGWSGVELDHNVIYRLWTDTNLSSFSDHDNTYCKREAAPGGVLPTATNSSSACSPAFPAPTLAGGDDYRLGNGRGVDWSPAGRHYGP